MVGISSLMLEVRRRQGDPTKCEMLQVAPNCYALHSTAQHTVPDMMSQQPSVLSSNPALDMYVTRTIDVYKDPSCMWSPLSSTSLSFDTLKLFLIIRP